MHVIFWLGVGSQEIILPIQTLRTGRCPAPGWPNLLTALPPLYKVVSAAVILVELVRVMGDQDSHGSKGTFTASTFHCKTMILIIIPNLAITVNHTD